MKAHWLIKNTGERMSVQVMSGFEQFEAMINMHSNMQFLEWEKV